MIARLSLTSSHNHLDRRVNSVIRVQVKESQVITVVSKDRLVFHIVHMEHTVRTCQREVFQVAKAILVVQCTIGFAEIRHIVAKVAFVFKWYPDDAFAGSLYCFASLLYLFYSITSKSGISSCLANFRTSLKVIGSESTFMYPCM